MNTHAPWRSLGILCLILASTEATGQETLWKTYEAAGSKALHQARYAEAERLFLAAIEQAEKLGKEDPRLAESLNSVAVLYATQGKQVEAEPIFRRALEINENVLGPVHPAVAITLKNLAILYATQGKSAEAERLLGRSLFINTKVWGPEHPEVAANLTVLAKFHVLRGNYLEAERLFKLSLGINEKVLGPDHPEVAASLESLADLLRATWRDVEAQKLEDRARKIRAVHVQANSSDPGKGP